MFLTTDVPQSVMHCHESYVFLATAVPESVLHSVTKAVCVFITAVPESVMESVTKAVHVFVTAVPESRRAQDAPCRGREARAGVAQRPVCGGQAAHR